MSEKYPEVAEGVTRLAYGAPYDRGALISRIFC
jgi:hypothetical protein